MNCIIENCSKESKCKGLCWMHYKRQQVEGNRKSYNDYHRIYQAEHIEKVQEYRSTEKYKSAQKKARDKYARKVRDND